MRDISDYTSQYEKSDFENKYQVKYRRKKVLALMEQYPHDDIFEIGCGLSPLALFLPNLGKCTIVEPSETALDLVQQRQVGIAHGAPRGMTTGWFPGSMGRKCRLHG